VCIAPGGRRSAHKPEVYPYWAGIYFFNSVPGAAQRARASGRPLNSAKIPPALA
jgi:hypothetical protein